jgi:hypothetical protein
MDIEFSKLSLNSCKICNNNCKNEVCDICTYKLNFLYSDIVDLNCIYCQYYNDYEDSYICTKCLAL